MTIPEGMTPDKLRQIADWLDTYDKLAIKFFDLLDLVKYQEWATNELRNTDTIDARKVAEGKEIQEDLRSWANALEQS